jgi:hypothetical protein
LWTTNYNSQLYRPKFWCSKINFLPLLVSVLGYVGGYANSSENIRIRIDPPDKGTRYDHIHFYDANGNSLDINLGIVPEDSPAAHIAIKPN